MEKGQKNVFECAANFLRGKKCIFCGSFKVGRTRSGYVRCRNKSCVKQKSLAQLRREIGIPQTSGEASHRQSLEKHGRQEDQESHKRHRGVLEFCQTYSV